MTIYELTGATAQLYELLSSGEIDEQTFNDTLEAMGVDDKIDGCVKVIKQLEADRVSLKEEAERLTKRAKAVENNAKRVRDSLVMYLQATEQKQVKTLLFTVSQKTTQSVQIAEGAELPTEYLKVTTTADKTALKNALLKGEHIDGVTLETKQSIQIR